MLTWSDILDYLRIGWIFRSFNFNSLIRYKSLNFPQLFFFIYLQISNYRTHMCEPSGTHVSSMHICERALFPLLRMVVNNNNNINQLYLVIIMPDFHLVCFFDFPILLYEAWMIKTHLTFIALQNTQISVLSFGQKLIFLSTVIVTGGVRKCCCCHCRIILAICSPSQ